MGNWKSVSKKVNYLLTYFQRTFFILYRADFPDERIQPYNTTILESELTSFDKLIVSPEQNDERKIVCKTTNEIEFLLACLDKKGTYLIFFRAM